MLILGIMIVMVSGVVSGIPETVLFEDDFSSNHPLDTEWDGEYVEMPDSEDLYDDIYSSNLLPHEDYYLVTKDDAAAIISVDTTGYENIELSYYRRTFSTFFGDKVVVEWRIGDSGSWMELERTGPFISWNQNTESLLSTADDQEEIQIRFWLDDGDSDYALWDDIKVIGYEIDVTPPTAVIKVEDEDNLIIYEPVKFYGKDSEDNEGGSGIASYSWDFDGDEIEDSNKKNPKHTFTESRFSS